MEKEKNLALVLSINNSAMVCTINMNFLLLDAMHI